MIWAEHSAHLTLHREQPTAWTLAGAAPGGVVVTTAERKCEHKCYRCRAF